VTPIAEGYTCPFAVDKPYVHLPSHVADDLRALSMHHRLRDVELQRGDALLPAAAAQVRGESLPSLLGHASYAVLIHTRPVGREPVPQMSQGVDGQRFVLPTASSPICTSPSTLLWKVEAPWCLKARSGWVGASVATQRLGISVRVVDVSLTSLMHPAKSHLPKVASTQHSDAAVHSTRMMPMG
jgi:hypothetical protein